MAPEMILKEQSDFRFDWWSLGILAYELIFGIPPFYSTDVQKMY
jgi:serine/threonine protein kinase